MNNRVIFSGLTLLAPLLAQAQQVDSPSTLPPTLPTITVSASGLALGSDEMSQPVSVLEGEELVLRRAATLGETLAGEPGITSTHFGAGASRPIVRGMDGPRVKVLSDGAEVQDASAISPDHAVAVEPLLSRQIEVLRGPAALAYGGGAIGGVVNMLDDKVPTAIPEQGVAGQVELRAGSVDRERAGAFGLTGGVRGEGGGIVLRVEGLRRLTDDYRAGGNWRNDEGGRAVEGSYSEAGAGSVGLSLLGERGHIGLAYSEQHSEYGIPGHNHAFENCVVSGDQLACVEEEHDHEHGIPWIALLSKRWDLRGELRAPFTGFEHLRLRASSTDYGHDEIEDGEEGPEVATRFKSQAHDARVELVHQPVAGWRGLLGVQTTRRDFSARGAEAYVEPTLTQRHALFAVEQKQLGGWRYDLGLRKEWQSIEAQDSGRAADHAGLSLSAGALWQFTPAYALGATFTRAQRLPTAEELYADGAHAATSTIERGNPDLKRETSHNIDLTLRKTRGPTTFSVSAFQNRVQGYIHARTLDAHEGLQLVEYAQRDASFTGLEGQVRRQLNRHLGLTLWGDAVRASLDDGGNLPRTPPARMGLRGDGGWSAWGGAWTAQAEWLHAAPQDRVADHESATPGYSLLGASVSYAARWGGQDWQVWLKGTNLGDEPAWAHTSFIKDAAPLAGRNVALGLRTTF